MGICIMVLRFPVIPMKTGGAAVGGDRAGSSSGGSKLVIKSDGSFYFDIESMPGTTVISWKKLLRHHAGEISALRPAVQPPSGCFNSAQRLYVKSGSDKEDFNDVVLGNHEDDTEESDSDLKSGSDKEDFNDVVLGNHEDAIEESDSDLSGYIVQRRKLQGVNIEPSMVQTEHSKKRIEEDDLPEGYGNPSKKPRMPQADGVADSFSNMDEQEMKIEKRKQANRESARRSRMRKQLIKEAERMKMTNSQQQVKLITEPSDRSLILRIHHTPKKECARLENAIKDLEKLVTETRPPSVAAQADSSSRAIRKRLPQDIKNELAKVANYAQASEGKITTEMVDRLMAILGHLVLRKTLKKNLKTMVNAELAKPEKDSMVQLVKSKVPEEQA